MGLLFDDEPNRADMRAPIELALSPGTVTLITGPSGSGKTSIMRAVRQTAQRDGRRLIDVDRVKLTARPAVDLLGCDAPSAMRALAQAGLAEAKCFIRRPNELSQGQRERLALAVAMDRAAKQGANTLLYADEFAARLDRATARSVSRSFSNSVRRDGRIAAIVATSHDDLEESLRPNETVRLTLDGRATVERAGRDHGKPERSYEIVDGSMRDYKALASLHYRAGSPAVPVKTLCARDMRTGEIIGVLVVCMPTLNGAWRRLAWRDRYHTGDKRVNARRLNDEVRRIARVIVDPRYRALGVATALVRAYLDNPLTPCTEAVAAMGQWSRFFEAASMTRYELATPPAHARLLDALEYAGVEPYRLATPESAWRRANQAAGEAFLARELRLWARCRGCDRSLPRDDLGALWRSACRRVGVSMAAYAHGSMEET